MFKLKIQLPQVVNVLLVTAFVTAAVVGFGEYLFSTKPLQDKSVKDKKEIQTLTEQVKILTQAQGVLQTYANTEFGFSFQYPASYEMVDVRNEANAPTDVFVALRKKNASSTSSALWVAVRDTNKALVPETSYTNKVITSETKIGKENIAATSISLLPGRGDEFGSSLQIVHVVAPLKNQAKSVVLTNIGDSDLAVFQIALRTFAFQ